MSNERVDRRHHSFGVEFSGRPSAMDRRQSPKLRGNAGEIERKRRQTNATASAITNIHRHIENELVETAILSGYRLGVAERLLPPDELERLRAITAENERLYHDATIETAQIAYNHFLDNLDRQQIGSGGHTPYGEFLDGFEDGLHLLTGGLYPGRLERE